MKIDYKEVQKTLFEIRKDIKSILCNNGGMDNGYETYAEGGIKKNCSNSVSVVIPGLDVTKRNLRDIGYKIEEHIKKQYSEIIESGLIIVIEYHHIEYGCYRLSVSLKINHY